MNTVRSPLFPRHHNLLGGRMLTRHQKRQWFFVILLSFQFMLFHQADKLLISPLTSKIMEDFQINKAKWEPLHQPL